MVREGQKRKNRGSSPKIDKSPQLAALNNLNGSSPFCQGQGELGKQLKTIMKRVATKFPKLVT